MKPSLTPKDFFLHLAMFVFLYISTFSFLRFIFDVINYAFPDQQYDYFDPYSTSIRWALSILIVLFPAYLFLGKKINEDLEAQPEKRELGFRKWLIYFTLFITSISILVDLITLINTFLQGEISIRFVLKVIAVLVVAGTIFGYYLYVLRNKATEDSRVGRNLSFVVSAVVLLAIVSGFVIMGSPATQRKLRQDDQRVSDLQMLQANLISYWTAKQNLPTTLTELKDSISVTSLPVDPVTNENYTYQKSGNNSFKLCANFALETSKRSISNRTYEYPLNSYTKGGNSAESWTHSAGQTCFDRTIDPERYPPISRLNKGIIE